LPPPGIVYAPPELPDRATELITGANGTASHGVDLNPAKPDSYPVDHSIGGGAGDDTDGDGAGDDTDGDGAGVGAGAEVGTTVDGVSTHSARQRVDVARVTVAVTAPALTFMVSACPEAPVADFRAPSAVVMDTVIREQPEKVNVAVNVPATVSNLDTSFFSRVCSVPEIVVCAAVWCRRCPFLARCRVVLPAR